MFYIFFSEALVAGKSLRESPRESFQNVILACGKKGRVRVRDGGGCLVSSEAIFFST